MLAAELERADEFAAASITITKILQIIAGGEVPQLTGFLYGGLFVIVLSVVNLIGKKRAQSVED